MHDRLSSRSYSTAQGWASTCTAGWGTYHSYSRIVKTNGNRERARHKYRFRHGSFPVTLHSLAADHEALMMAC
jgi:hypothetical protein